MATGIFADRNRIRYATVSETGWSATAPASNAKTLPVGIVARSTGAGTTGSPVSYKGNFADRHPITYGGLFNTNMQQAERVRLRLFSDADQAGTTLYDSRDADTGLDRRVIPCLVSPGDLRFGAPNQFRGDLPPEDFALFQTNVHFQVPLCRPLSFQFDWIGRGYLRTSDPSTNGDPADYLQIGHAWLSDSIQPTYDRVLGAGDAWNPTDEITRTPGGGVFIEPGTGFRSAEIPYEFLTLDDADLLFDQAARVGYSEPVVWIPDIDSARDLFRYGFLGRRVDPFRKTRRYPTGETATLNLEEITT